jgi:predicted DNA-binding protein with PD1-like motif
MKHSQAEQGRVFIIRLEDGDVLHEEIEKFAQAHGVLRAQVSAVGGVDKGSRLVVGPKEGRVKEIVPMILELSDVYEATGTGTIFPDAQGDPILHMHLSCGREEKSVTGCVRSGVKVWHILEVIMAEITGSEAKREKDAATGFELLVP